MSSKYYDDLRRNGIINDFTLNYVDEHRTELAGKYTDVYEFKKAFNVDEEFMNKFIAYAEKKNVKKDEKGLKTSEKLLRTQIKALIARDLWNTNAYYVIINELNAFLNKGLQCIDDGTFTKVKIDQ
jgi:carboxyl-terminal processing protease